MHHAFAFYEMVFLPRLRGSVNVTVQLIALIAFLLLQQGVGPGRSPFFMVTCFLEIVGVSHSGSVPLGSCTTLADDLPFMFCLGCSHRRCIRPLVVSKLRLVTLGGDREVCTVLVSLRLTWSCGVTAAKV